MEVILLLSIGVAVVFVGRRVRRVPRVDYVLVGTPQPRQSLGPARRPVVPPRRARPPVVALRPAPIVIHGPAYVTDGDGLVIRKVNIRLFGIDAPEQNHPYGIRAKRTLIWLCKGQQVRAEVTGQDHFGRTIAICMLPDGRDLSAEMVKCGLALDWPKFSGGRYGHLETPDARRKLWLADARQKGRMDVWARFEAQQAARRAARA